MFDFIRNIFRFRATPMNVIYINSANIIHNLKYLQKLHKHGPLFPVLKSNAYGHGLQEITQILDKTDVPYLVVDSYPEYMIVKKYSDKNILLLGETLPENYRFFDHKKVTFSVYNIKTLEKLSRMNRNIKIHLFINTGMYREGANPHTIKDYITILKKSPKIELEGILSHFHSADIVGINTMDDQIKIFKKMYYNILDAGFTPTYRYMSNSAGILKLQDDFFNAARPGLALYGYNPLSPGDEFYDLGTKLRPALSIKSRIIGIQEVSQGQGISYEYQWIAPSSTTIGIVPFGYAEGLSISASNNISFSRYGKKIDQVGRITMNLSCVNLQDHHVKIGDEIEIISSKIGSHNSIYSLAEKSNQIIYETLVKLESNIRRVVI